MGGSTVAVTIGGNNATLTNLGTLSQTGTGRGVFDNAATGFMINNGSSTNSTALMQTADADVVRVNVGGVTLNNYGTLRSSNASAGGSQAVDFEPIHSGLSNVINNYATGVMQASQADAVRPGVNGVVNNGGLIKSTTTNGSSSDGVDAQNNTGVVVNNAVDPATGLPSSAGPSLIEGARHGITGGAIDNTVTFTTTVTNNTGGIIQGDNGSGINLDGFDAKQTATIVNNGTITGNGVSGDGDGIAVDGVVTITNTGIIRSLNAVSLVGSPVAQSEAITVGGGTILNSGTIQGSVAAGNTNAVGRGITLAGNDITSGPLTGTREAIYGNATITNQSGGSIIGDTDSAIVVDGPASGFTVTINNNAGGTVIGGGALNAAILTGADNNIINNSGIVNGASSGKAIAMGAGNDTLNLFTGSSVAGGIDGGDGADAIHLKGTGVGTLSNTANVETLSVDAGHWTLTGGQIYSGSSSIAVSATLEIKNAIIEFGNLTVSGALLTDPTTLIFDHDLNIDPTGFIAASFGDLFDVHGNFIDHSTQKTKWNTTRAKLKFTGVGAHTVAAHRRRYRCAVLGVRGQFRLV